MHFRVQHLLALLLAVVAWSAMVAGASAERLRVSAQHFRIIWTSLVWETTNRAGRILCPMTLEGSFHSATIVKTIGSLVGFVTRASVKGSSAECTGGTMTILSSSLPWHVTYQGFKGTLPSLTGVILLFVGFAFQTRPSGSLACLARSEARHPAQGIASVEPNGKVTSFQPESGKKIPLTGEGGLCSFGGEIDFNEEESGTVTNETGSLIFVTLI